MRKLVGKKKRVPLSSQRGTLIAPKSTRQRKMRVLHRRMVELELRRKKAARSASVGA
jgi:hypothetical protein